MAIHLEHSSSGFGAFYIEPGELSEAEWPVTEAAPGPAHAPVEGPAPASSTWLEDLPPANFGPTAPSVIEPLVSSQPAVLPSVPVHVPTDPTPALPPATENETEQATHQPREDDPGDRTSDFDLIAHHERFIARGEAAWAAMSEAYQRARDAEAERSRSGDETYAREREVEYQQMMLRAEEERQASEALATAAGADPGGDNQSAAESERLARQNETLGGGRAPGGDGSAFGGSSGGRIAAGSVTDPNDSLAESGAGLGYGGNGTRLGTGDDGAGIAVTDAGSRPGLAEVDNENDRQPTDIDRNAESVNSSTMSNSRAASADPNDPERYRADQLLRMERMLNEDAARQSPSDGPQPDGSYRVTIVGVGSPGPDPAGSGLSFLNGAAYGALRVIAEPVLQVGDLLQVGNELGRSWVTGDAPRDISYLSMLGQIAGQGASTEQIIGSGFASLMSTPDRIGDAYRRGDYYSLGEEVGSLGVGVGLAAYGGRGALTDVRIGARLATEDFGASDLGQRIAASLDSVDTVLGLRSYAVAPGSGTRPISYGPLDDLGRPTGVNATITPELINTGTPANPSIMPPGWSGDGVAFNQARGHLLGRQLGGSGDIAENLVTLQQNWTNSPVMRGFEGQVRVAVEAGQTVKYSATPLYDGGNLIPRGVTLIGQGNDGFGLAVTVLNPIGRKP